MQTLKNTSVNQKGKVVADTDGALGKVIQCQSYHSQLIHNPAVVA